MIEKLYRLSRRLLPTGRAFRQPYSGVADKIDRGIINIEAATTTDILSLLNSILADNDKFSVYDCRDWEVRLGLISNESLTVEQRRAAILRKYNHPGTIPARQNYRYLERELRAAGFDVYVHENRFDDGMYGYESVSASEAGLSGIAIQLGTIQLGDGLLGDGLFDKIANKIEYEPEYYFDAGSVLNRTFFISSIVLEYPAEIESSRREEFRELVLKIKPVQTVAFLNITYI